MARWLAVLACYALLAAPARAQIIEVHVAGNGGVFLGGTTLSLDTVRNNLTGQYMTVLAHAGYPAPNVEAQVGRGITPARVAALAGVPTENLAPEGTAVTISPADPGDGRNTMQF